MITHEDQIELFNLVSRELHQNITCYAFGGTAMMFYGYKDETKDVDILFEQPEEKTAFIKAIEKLGFTETTPFKIYIPEKLRDPHRPLMYKRGDTRFDLFVKKIFKTLLSPKKSSDHVVHALAPSQNACTYRKSHRNSYHHR